MPDRRIHFERIAVRLHGVPASIGRQVADALGQAIAGSVAEPHGKGDAKSRHLPSLDLGTLAAPRDATGAGVAETIGRALAARLDGRQR